MRPRFRAFHGVVVLKRGTGTLKWVHHCMLAACDCCFTQNVTAETGNEDRVKWTRYPVPARRKAGMKRLDLQRPDKIYKKKSIQTSSSAKPHAVYLFTYPPSDNESKNEHPFIVPKRCHNIYTCLASHYREWSPKGSSNTTPCL